MDLDLFKLLPLLLLPPPLLAREYERPCIITAFIPLAMEKDFRWLLMVTGSGSLSMRCTGVQETMARQHRSCRLNTGGRKKNTVKAQETSRAASFLQPFFTTCSFCLEGEKS